MASEIEAAALAFLYEELAENRAAQDGIWTTQHFIPRTQEDYDSFHDTIRELERAENALVESIESLGGEDPEL